MAKVLVDDALWELIEPHLPRSKPARTGHPRVPDRAALRQRHIQPVIAQRGVVHRSGLGTTRWVVERTISSLHQYRRLRVRYERRADIHEAFLTLGCIFICCKFALQVS